MCERRIRASFIQYKSVKQGYFSKRSMYGRTKFELLKLRVLHHPKKSLERKNKKKQAPPVRGHLDCCVLAMSSSWVGSQKLARVLSCGKQKGHGQEKGCCLLEMRSLR